jgi:hypothetical protein
LWGTIIRGVFIISLGELNGFILNNNAYRIKPKDHVYNPSAVYFLYWKYSGGVISLFNGEFNLSFFESN